MHLVYLDQCVLSRFLDRPQNQQWHELRGLLMQGNANRKIMCPKSLEHLIETAMLPDDDAILLDELMGKLSFGWALTLEFSLVARQIINKLRNSKVCRADILQKGHLRPLTFPGTLAKMREIKAGVDQNNTWVTQGVNEVNALTRNGRRPDSNLLSYLVKRRTGASVGRLLREVATSLKTGRVVVRAEEGNPEIVDWTSKVVYELIVKYRLSPAEGASLCKLLVDEALGFIPTLRIKAELEAIQFFRREKIEPGDQYDITRAACALPYADIFITDGGKANAIKELKLDVICGTEVFSMKNYDLPSLTARLRKIVG